MKFKIVGFDSNANYDWKKRRKPKAPKVERSIPDKDLCLQKGDSYKQALKAENDYFYKGKPYGVETSHV